MSTSADAQPRAPPGFTDGAAQGPQAIPALTFHTPGDGFSHFIDGYVISKLCSWANERADVYFAENTTKKKVHRLKWKPVTTDDMHVFFGLLIAMGVVQLPNMHMYWSHNAVFGGPRIFTKKVMSRNMFLSIL